MEVEDILTVTSRTKGREATNGVIPGRFALSVGHPALPTTLGWKWTKLNDVARLESGHTPSRKHPEYWDGDVPWIGIKDAVDNHGRIINNTYQHVTELGLANSSARLLPKNTVCLSRTASIGYVTVMGRPMATSQDFVNWVCSDRIEPQYLKAILIAEHESLWRFASGTTHQTIYYPEVKAFHVCLPPLPEQKAIAHILGTLDDKIELNREMNQTLEAMARAIFKSWFVDFDPVRAKMEGRQPAGMDAATAELFPDEFEESALGIIPKGWKVKSLDQIANFLNGLALQKYPPTDDNYLPVIKIAELRRGINESTAKASLYIDNKYIIQDGDILFSWSGSLGVCAWCGGKGALNQHLFKVTSVEYPKWFYYQWIKYHLPQFQEIAASKATTMGHIQRHHLDEAKVIVPPQDTLQMIDKAMEPLLNLFISNNLEARTLASTRDTLLPKLLSGEIRVKEAEKIAAKAM